MCTDLSEEGSTCSSSLRTAVHRAMTRGTATSENGDVGGLAKIDILELAWNRLEPTTIKFPGW